MMLASMTKKKKWNYTNQFQNYSQARWLLVLGVTLSHKFRPVFFLTCRKSVWSSVLLSVWMRLCFCICLLVFVSLGLCLNLRVCVLCPISFFMFVLVCSCVVFVFVLSVFRICDFLFVLFFPHLFVLLWVFVFVFLPVCVFVGLCWRCLCLCFRFCNLVSFRHDSTTSCVIAPTVMSKLMADSSPWAHLVPWKVTLYAPAS